MPIGKSESAFNSLSVVNEMPHPVTMDAARGSVTVNQNSSAFSPASLNKSKIRSCVACAFQRLGLCNDAVMPAGESKGHVEGVLNLAVVTHVAPARKTIRHRNDRSDSILVLCAGIAIVGIITPKGSRQILSILLPGDVLSTGSLLLASEGYFSESVSDVTYRKFSSQEVKSYIFQSPIVFEQFMSVLSEDRLRINQLVVDIGCNSSEERISNLILNLHARQEKLNAVIGNAFEFPLRLHHIADALGLSSVYVSKAIRKLESNGYIELDHRILKILDLKGLHAAAGHIN